MLVRYVNVNDDDVLLQLHTLSYVDVDNDVLLLMLLQVRALCQLMESVVNCKWSGVHIHYLLCVSSKRVFISVKTIVLAHSYVLVNV